MNQRDLEFIEETLNTCRLEMTELLRENEWAIVDSLDMIESSLGIIRTIKNRRETIQGN